MLNTEFRTPLGEVNSINRTKLVTHILVRWTVVKGHILINHFFIFISIGGRALCNIEQQNIELHCYSLPPYWRIWPELWIAFFSSCIGTPRKGIQECFCTSYNRTNDAGRWSSVYSSYVDIVSWTFTQVKAPHIRTLWIYASILAANFEIHVGTSAYYPDFTVCDFFLSCLLISLFKVGLGSRYDIKTTSLGLECIKQDLGEQVNHLVIIITGENTEQPGHSILYSQSVKAI